MKGIEIDRSKRLKEEPDRGHNRWHPDIPPVLEVEPGEEVVLETRDALDGQILSGVTTAELEGMDRARKQGKRIGRPRVTDRKGFNDRFGAILERVTAGEMSRRKAARDLNIGYATLKRLIDAQNTGDANGG